MMSTLPASNFGALLRRDRRAAGLTQQELAVLAGVSVDAISLIERGLTRAPHRDTLDLLAAALGLAPTALAEWQGAARRLRQSGEEIASRPPGCEPPTSITQLPVPVTTLVGREEEMRTISKYLL